MDPDMFDIFAPRPGMDPFALGRLMSTNPEALAPMLGSVAGPPKDGQSFGDWITEQQGGYGPHVQPQGPAQSALAAAPDAPGAGGQGTPMFPPMTQTPGQPPSAGGVTGDVSRLLTTAFPGPPSTSAGYMPSGTGEGGTPGEISQPGIPGMDFLAGPTPITPDTSRSPEYLGPTPMDAFGSLPGTPSTSTPPPTAPAETPQYTRSTVPDILAPLTGGKDTRTASAEAPGKPANAQAANAALGRLGSSLAGLKAPPTPAQPSLETPRGVGGQATKAGGNIAQLIAALMGGGGGGGVGTPYRLGPALYGGGRGLY